MTRPASIPLTREQVVERALSQVAFDCHYRLGRGGMDPSSPRAVQLDPETHRLEADCSGFSAWCLGESRYQPGDAWFMRSWGGWVSTTAIVADGKDATGGAYELASASMPGNLLVFPALRGVRSYGHVGVVTAVRDGAPRLVAHCSASHPRGRAIQVTSPAVFVRNGAIEVTHRKLRAPAPGPAACAAGCPCACHPRSPPAA